MHGSVIGYYIHRAQRHWVLWQYWYDDNWERWEWSPVGFVPRSQASRKQAAIHLMIDFWGFRKADTNIDHYHWINETGEFNTSEWRTIGLMVWREVGSPKAPDISKVDQEIEDEGDRDEYQDIPDMDERLLPTREDMKKD